MMMTITVAVFLLAVMGTGKAGLLDTVSSGVNSAVFTGYNAQIAAIQSFQDTTWHNLIQSTEKYPSLANQTRLLYAFNISLIPLLVPANGRADHAEAMSLSCVFVFLAGSQMVQEQITTPVMKQNDIVMNTQLAAVQAKMLALKASCLTYMGAYFALGPALKIFNGITSLVAMI